MNKDGTLNPAIDVEPSFEIKARFSLVILQNTPSSDFTSLNSGVSFLDLTVPCPFLLLAFFFFLFADSKTLLDTYWRNEHNPRITTNAKINSNQQFFSS